MSNAVTKKAEVVLKIESPQFIEEVAKVLPKHLTPQRLSRIAVTAIMKNPDLLKCSVPSIMNSLMICAQAGLEPDGRMAHLIPYGNVCQLIFDWKGMVSLALRNGYEVVYGDKVCEGDTFDARVVDGIKKINHSINYRQPRGEAYAYYTVCQNDGHIDFEIMTKDEVEAIRERSRAKNAGPWRSDYDEMAKKTVIRRMSKRWDLMPEIRDVINADDDTPPGIGPAPVAAPLFKEPKAPATDVESELVPEEPASEPAAPVEEEAPNPSALIKTIRKKLTTAKASESGLVSFLVGIGVASEGNKSLEDVHASNEKALGEVSKNMDSLLQQMKGQQ